MNPYIFPPGSNAHWVERTNRDLAESNARSRRESEAAMRFAREQRERAAIPQIVTPAPAMRFSGSRKKKPGILQRALGALRRRLAGGAKK